MNRDDSTRDNTNGNGLCPELISGLQHCLGGSQSSNLQSHNERCCFSIAIGLFGVPLREESGTTSRADLEAPVGNTMLEEGRFDLSLENGLQYFEPSGSDESGDESGYGSSSSASSVKGDMVSGRNGLLNGSSLANGIQYFDDGSDSDESGEYGPPQMSR